MGSRAGGAQAKADLSIHSGEKWYTPGLGVFIIYTRKEAADVLGCSLRTAVTAFQQLLEAGLIFEEYSGHGKLKRIYLLKPDMEGMS